MVKETTIPGTFPKDFLWGAASAAYQVEGAVNEDGRGASIWDTFSHTPGKTFRGDTGDVACDSYHRWREDVALLSQMHLKSYRFSVAWPRIAPNGDTAWNERGFAYYESLVDALLKNGIEPCITLYHWDLPQTLQDAGGWLNPATAQAFAAYAGAVAARFKGRVKKYITINEIQCAAYLGYGNGEHAPGLRLPLAAQFAAWENLMYAHCLAAQAVRAADGGALVGAASTGRVCYPSTQSAADVEAARAAMFYTADDDWAFTHQMFCDPLILGRWPEFAPGKSEGLQRAAAAVPASHTAQYAAGRMDFLCLNIYNGSEVRAGADGPAYVEAYPGFPRTALKWPVTPECLNWGPRYLGARYGLPMYISENGLSCNDKVYLDGRVHDADRIDFLTRYLRALRQGIAAGADVRGYYHWALTDNFEWSSGYGERFGLAYVDYRTGERIPKDSAAWYAQVAASNGAGLG
jgi:beta-glucosidase